MITRYSRDFIDRALVAVNSRGAQPLSSVAEALHVNLHTLKTWIKNARRSGERQDMNKEKRPQDWIAAERLEALLESHALSGDTLHAWCRERGLFAHDLEQWKTDFSEEKKASSSETRALKKDYERLRRELTRKDKALAETAALLVLQKKFQALWGEEEG